MEKKYLYRLFAIVACLLSSLSVVGQEAYAVYRPDYTRLTFYYDTLRTTRGGTSYDLNSGSVNPGWYTDGTMSSVTRVVFNPSFADARPTSTFGWFFGMENLQSISDIKYLNTSEVTDMTNMFRLCSKLTTLDVSHFNTEKVTSMANMFWQCQALTALDVSGFVTDNVSSMKNMFIYCKNLRNLDVSNFNTENVTSMADMFHDCRMLRSLDLGNFNTANVTNMAAMFRNCGVTSLDLSNFNTANVTNMQSMFAESNSLTSLDLSSFNTFNVTNMQSLFYQCSRLTSLDLSSFNTANVTNMSGMFSFSRILKTIYVGSGWNTAAVTLSNELFMYCDSLVGGQGTVYDPAHIDITYAHIDGGPSNPGYLSGKSTSEAEAYVVYTSDNTTLTFYYDNLRSTRTGTTYDLNEDYSYPDWYLDETMSNVTHAVFDPSFADARPITTLAWFMGMENLQSITDIQYLNTDSVRDMSYMFCFCNSLTSLDVSHFNTENVTNMSSMFSYCESLTSLDVSHFNTSNVIDMGGMFYVCTSLSSLDVSHFNTENVEYMSNMFEFCESLTSLDVTHFNTGKVFDMTQMFRVCSGLTSLDLSHFNTENVRDMYGMFSDCYGLTSLDLRSFNTANATDMGVMFETCRNLTTIYVSENWSTASVTRSVNMFRNCSKIRGEQGTTYDANHVDAAYAHVDGGPSNPGYLSSLTPAVHGDLTGDGKVDVADVTVLISVVLGINEGDVEVYDLNGDGKVDVADVTALIAYVLSN